MTTVQQPAGVSTGPALGARTGAAALLQAFLPGEQGAGAVAGVLSGRVVPSGKLPVQVARDPGGGPATYLHGPLADPQSGTSDLEPSPLLAFGHGLSYTGFGYSDLASSATRVPTDGAVEGAVTVADTGDRDGVELTGPVREVGHDRVLDTPVTVRPR